jgi:CubicO group peptidase (beta-lactamase class C family)
MWLPSSLSLVLACSGTDLARVADAGDSGAPAPSRVADAGSTTADASSSAWTQVRDAVLSAASAEQADLAFAVWDERGALRFDVSSGAFMLDTRVAIASASKYASGLVLFELIRRGDLTLASTTGDVLGWTGPNAAITLEQLLSFTSGLPPEDPCTRVARSTLAACVSSIEVALAEAPPATRFDYGSTHLHVAARMAEVATGQTWQALFDEVLARPLGLSADALYFTFPRQALGRLNPLVAGGLRMTMNEYAPLLQLGLQRGVFGDVSVGTPEVFDAQRREPFDVTITRASSPLLALGFPFHYGLTAWLECDTPRTGCERASSPGAFGFTPWFDREAGYVAIIGMEVGPSTMDVPNGAVGFAVELEQTLQPLIREALAR